MITSHLKASYLYRFITKDEKNQVFLFTQKKTTELACKDDDLLLVSEIKEEV